MRDVEAVNLACEWFHSARHYEGDKYEFVFDGCAACLEYEGGTSLSCGFADNERKHPLSSYDVRAGLAGSVIARHLQPDMYIDELPLGFDMTTKVLESRDRTALLKSLADYATKHNARKIGRNKQQFYIA